MNSRDLAALLSSLISELLFVLLLSPSSNPLSITNSSSYRDLFPIIHHLLSTSDIAASLSLLSASRKRKRTHQQPPPSSSPTSAATDDGEEPSPESVRPRRVNSVIPRDPDSFKLCFRMSSSTFEWLAGLLEPLLECRDPAGSPLKLSAETRLGIGLFRLSTGSDYHDVSRRFRVSEEIAKFCAKQLCRVLCTNFRFWVGFPSPIELTSVAAAFESLAGLPNCCGAIDCTRFRIVTNNGNNTSSPKEKLREESIAVQIVADSSSRILSVFAGFRGDNADSRVLKSSTLYKDIEAGRLLDSSPTYINGVDVPRYLVGDDAYPLLPWLIVPFVDPAAENQEKDFNAAINSMILPAQRTIASLKNWGVLNKPIEAEFKTAVAYVGACSILHNVLLMREDYSVSSDNDLIDRSEINRRYQRRGDSNIEENSSIEAKGLVIRSVLASRAKELRISDRPMNLNSVGL